MRYAIRIREMDAGEGKVKIGALLAMDPTGAGVALPGEAVKEPAFGLDAMWIDERAREEASFRGYTIVDPATVLTTHLTEIIKEHMSELLTFAEVKKLIKDLPKETQDAARRCRARAHLLVGRAARAADPAEGARLDPRPRRHPRSHRGSRAGDARSRADHRARARAPGAPALLPAPQRRRLPADHHALAGLGAGVRGSADRRRPAPHSSRSRRRGCTISSPTCAPPSSAPRRWARRPCCSPPPPSARSCAR